MSLRTLLDNPTAAMLSTHLSRGPDGADNRAALDVLLPLRSAGPLAPLFCVHPALGIGWPYLGLLRHLPAERPVYGLQAAGLAKGTAAAHHSIEDMAREYVRQLITVQPTGPYHLLGWSFGGLVAHEIAVLLQRDGHEVALLAILDAYPASESTPHLRVIAEEETYRALLESVGAPVPCPDGARRPEVLTEAFQRIGGAMGGLDDETIGALAQTFATNVRLQSSFTPARFRGDLILFTSTIHPHEQWPTPDLWHPYIDGQIRHHRVACPHGRMLHDDAPCRDRADPVRESPHARTEHRRPAMKPAASESFDVVVIGGGPAGPPSPLSSPSRDTASSCWRNEHSPATGSVNRSCRPPSTACAGCSA